jgi:hypothetical protein
VSLPLPGSCFCGAVRYRLTALPMFVHCCHCTDCQKQTGGAFVINALIERANVELLPGSVEPVPIAMKTDSGRPHQICRCPTCQIAVWSHYGGLMQLAFVRVATLDRPHPIVPDVHIYTRSKVSWVSLPPGVRAFEAYYESRQEWPAESLARRAAILPPRR